MSTTTTAAQLHVAKDRYRGDWDENGTVTMTLPRDVAERLLAERGWQPAYHSDIVIGWWPPHIDPLVMMTQRNFREQRDTDEALRLALTAENA